VTGEAVGGAGRDGAVAGRLYDENKGVNVKSKVQLTMVSSLVSTSHMHEQCLYEYVMSNMNESCNM